MTTATINTPVQKLTFLTPKRHLLGFRNQTYALQRVCLVRWFALNLPNTGSDFSRKRRCLHHRSITAHATVTTAATAAHATAVTATATAAHAAEVTYAAATAAHTADASHATAPPPAAHAAEAAAHPSTEAPAVMPPPDEVLYWNTWSMPLNAAFGEIST